jgi:hypothetical protein
MGTVHEVLANGNTSRPPGIILQSRPNCADYPAFMSIIAGPGTDAAALLRAVRLFLLVLVCGDLCYLAMHVGHLTMSTLSAPHHSIETDGGLAEYYQYMKQLWLASFLAIAFLNRRHLALLAWAGFFGFLLIDDALQVHEQVGSWLARRLGLPGVAGLRPKDFGEMMVAAIVGASLLALLAAAWWRDREATWRFSRELLMLTAALAVCGVAIDAVHTIAFFRAPQVADPLAFLEDGGELLVISTLTAYALDLAARGTGAPAGLRRLVFGD